MNIIEDMRMEIDQRLAEIIGHNTPYGPEMSESLEETVQDDFLDIVPVNIPDGRKMHKGYLLQAGKLPIEKALMDHALLVVAEDFTYIHIGKDGSVVSKRDDKKIFHGKIITADSSPSFEKTKPFSLTIDNMYEITSLMISSPVTDVILYDPRPLRSTSRRITRPERKTNLYTAQLQLFLR